MHKFEQVSSDDHQMSVVPGRRGRCPGLMFSGGNEPETEAYSSFSDKDRTWK